MQEFNLFSPPPPLYKPQPRHFMARTKLTKGAKFPDFTNFLILRHKVLLHLKKCEGWRSTITFSTNCWLTKQPYFPNCTSDQGQKASSLHNAGVSLQMNPSLSGKAACLSQKKKKISTPSDEPPLTRKRCHLQMRLRIADKVEGLCLPN